VETLPERVVLTSRNGKDMTGTYPELAELADCVDVDCVLDGEIVALGPGSRPDFGRLQRRMGLSRPRPTSSASVGRTPVHLMVFDVLEAGEDSLLRVPYVDRRQRLQRPRVRRREHPCPGGLRRRSIDEAMDASRKLGLEGVMAKRRGSIYLPGRRTQTWVKLKHAATRDVIIVGWRTGTGERSPTFASLLLAAHDGNELVYLGRVGTGFDEHALTSLRSKLDSLTRKTPPLQVPAAESRDAQWVRPTPRRRGPIFRGNGGGTSATPRLEGSAR
jgi:bifunctional non-homologous end joining protein LigD